MPQSRASGDKTCLFPLVLDAFFQNVVLTAARASKKSSKNHLRSSRDQLNPKNAYYIGFSKVSHIVVALAGVIDTFSNLSAFTKSANVCIS